MPKTGEGEREVTDRVCPRVDGDEASHGKLVANPIQTKLGRYLGPHLLTGVEGPPEPSRSATSGRTPTATLLRRDSPSTALDLMLLPIAISFLPQFS